MLAIDLISDEIPPLKVNDKVKNGLHWMEEFKVTELPLIDNGKFLGSISEEELLNHGNPDALLKDLTHKLQEVFVFQHQHIYEVIANISQFKLSVIAVLDKNKNFIGIIDLPMIMSKIANLTAMKDPGGILQLELNINDYSLAEISNIVESNGAKILSSYIYTHDDSKKMDVTIKVNISDLSAIIQTFERYNYQVAAFFHKSTMEDDIKKRYDAFVHYLNI